MTGPFKDVKPMPKSAPLAGIGDNSARIPIDDMARGDFNDAVDKHKGLRQRILDLVGASGRASATNDDEAARCITMIGQMRACAKLVEDERVEVKAPYLAAGRAVDEIAKDLVGDLTAAEAKVRTMAEDYARQKELKRRADEAAALKLAREKEAERQAELARAEEENRPPAPEALAPVKVEAVPERTTMRGTLGQGSASTRAVKKAVITDYAKAFKAVKTVPKVQEAIQTAINALVRAGQYDLPGVTVEDDISLSVR